MGDRAVLLGAVSETEIGGPAASPAQTREWLLTRAKRRFVPIRRAFVQRPRGVAPRSGPLAEIVTHRHKRALLAYLIIVAGTSAELEDGWTLTLPSGAWARLMDTTVHAGQESALTAVSKTLTWLEARHLIRRQRIGRSRRIQVTLLREDGTNAEYTRPGVADRDPYIKLPHEFWLDGWSSKLSLPAIAMLLVASAEKPAFQLPTERVPEWYGWSADTAETGFRELRDAGLVTVAKERIIAPDSHTGWTVVNRYTLAPPFLHRGQSITRRRRTATKAAKRLPKKTTRSASAETTVKKTAAKKLTRRTAATR